MQKAVFQWRPESGSVAFVNVFDDLSRLGFDDELEDRLVPRPDPFTDEAGLDFGQIMAKRLALLDAEPALRAAYHSVANPLNSYGLPNRGCASRRAAGRTPAARGAAGLDLGFPWAAQGTVTVANGGDLAKQVGLFWRHQAALVPELPPGATPAGPPQPAPTTTPEPTPSPTANDRPGGARALLDGLDVRAEQPAATTAATGRTGVTWTATGAIPAAKCLPPNAVPTAAGIRHLTA